MTDTFSFPYHTVKTQYPNSSDRMQFGNSYEAVTKPRAPDQRMFILSFAGMKLFTQADGVTIDTTINAAWNWRALELFYEAHGCYTIFIYPHPYLGNINVKFVNPLAGPDFIPNGHGATAAFEIQLKEQP